MINPAVASLIVSGVVAPFVLFVDRTDDFQILANTPVEVICQDQGRVVFSRKFIFEDFTSGPLVVGKPIAGSKCSVIVSEGVYE